MSKLDQQLKRLETQHFLEVFTRTSNPDRLRIYARLRALDLTPDEARFFASVGTEAEQFEANAIWQRELADVQEWIREHPTVVFEAVEALLPRALGLLEGSLRPGRAGSPDARDSFLHSVAASLGVLVIGVTRQPRAKRQEPEPDIRIPSPSATAPAGTFPLSGVPGAPVRTPVPAAASGDSSRLRLAWWPWRRA